MASRVLQDPPFDGRTPIYVEHGADPRVAPGLDLPIGSMCRVGAVVYWKTAATATGWGVYAASTASGGDLTVDDLTVEGKLTVAETAEITGELSALSALIASANIYGGTSTGATLTLSGSATTSTGQVLCTNDLQVQGDAIVHDLVYAKTVDVETSGTFVVQADGDPLVQIGGAPHAVTLTGSTAAGASLQIWPTSHTSGGSVLLQSNVEVDANCSIACATLYNNATGGGSLNINTDGRDLSVQGGVQVIGAVGLEGLAVAHTWDGSSDVFTGVKVDVTDTHHSEGSRLLSLQSGGAPLFEIGPTSTIYGATAAGATLTIQPTSHTTAGVVSVTGSLHHATTDEAYYQARARTLMGLGGSNRLVSWFFDHFDRDSIATHYALNIGGGCSTNNHASHAMRLYAPASGTVYNQLGVTSGSRPSIFPASSTTVRWYCACRMKYVEAENGSSTGWLAFNAAVTDSAFRIDTSTTGSGDGAKVNFTIHGSGHTLLGNVARDADYHVYELYCTGARCYAVCDGAPVGDAAVTPSYDGTVAFTSYAGASTASDLYVDWVATASDWSQT